MNSKGIVQLSISLSLLLASINIIAQPTPIKRVLVEESTGTWCASCGYGGVYFEHLATNYPNVVPIAVHTGPGGQDPMAILSIELYMIPYFSGSPTFLMDRKDFPENSSSKPAISASNTWEHGLDTLDHYMNKIYNDAPLATIGISQTYDAVTRLITATITSNFVTNTTGNFRLNCFIVEDSVTGGPEYDQANSNFSGWTGGPSYLQDLINAPHPIPNYAHNHVLRAMLGNPEGVSASIPTTVIDGASYSSIFTYTIPADFDENQIFLIGVIQNYGPNKVADREIVNVNSQHLSTIPTSVSNLPTDFIDVNIFPNPITDQSVIEFYAKNSENVSCILYNIQGQMVKEIFSQDFKPGEYRINLNQQDLRNGTYILRFFNDNTSINKRIVINK